MSRPILTKWHRLVAAAKERDVSIHTMLRKTATQEERERFMTPTTMQRLARAVNIKELDRLVEMAEPMPKLFFMPDVVALAAQKQNLASARAMLEAGVFKLPYGDGMIVEFDQQIDGATYRDLGYIIPTLTCRNFVMMRDFGVSGQIKALVLRILSSTDKEMQYQIGDHIYISASMHTVTFTASHAIRDDGSEAFADVQFDSALSALVLCDPKTEMPYDFDLIKEARHSVQTEDQEAITEAAMLAMVLMRTQGVEAAEINEPRLNKARVASGKEPIPRHRVIRIGQLMNRHGQMVDRNAPHGTRGPMPIHIRRAHNRMQRIGPGRTQTKLVHIPQVLVNYHPDEPMPALEPVTVKA